MNDTMLRILSKEAGLLGLASATTGLTSEAGRRHQATPLATAALGYGLTAAALLGGLLKVQQQVALKVEGDGPLRKLVAEADAYGRVRGYVAKPDTPGRPPVDHAAVTQALGRQGLLTVVKDLRMRDLVQGAVALQPDGPGASLTHYFEKSEQVPSLVEIDVLMADDGSLAAAGGLLFQVLPGADPATLQQVAANLRGLPALASALDAGQTLEQVMAAALDGFEYDVLEQRSLAFSCSCSRARSRQALKVLGEDDLLALIVEGEAVVDCHFCHERYVFDREELAAILDELETEALEALFEDDEA